MFSTYTNPVLQVNPACLFTNPLQVSKQIYRHSNNVQCEIQEYKKQRTKKLKLSHKESSQSFYRVKILQNKRGMKIAARLLSREFHRSILEFKRGLRLFWQFDSACLDAISPHRPWAPMVRDHEPLSGVVKKQIHLETNQKR